MSKKDFVTVKVTNPVVFCKSIVEKDGGLFITFVDICTNEEYEHFQVMPSLAGKGESKAEKYLRRLARAADLESDYLILDMTSEKHLRDTSPIIGRFYRLSCKVKKALSDSQYANTSKRNYRSAEEIWHFEGDGEFSLDTAFYVLKNCNNSDYFKETILERIVKARSSYATATLEDYKTKFCWNLK